VGTVVQYHVEKEITDRSENSAVLKFYYDSISDQIFSFNGNGVVNVCSAINLALIGKIKLHGPPVSVVLVGALIPERNLMAAAYPAGIQLLTMM
jgi:hypothetical protein